MVEDLLKFRAIFSDEQWEEMVIAGARCYGTNRLFNKADKMNRASRIMQSSAFHTDRVIARRLYPKLGTI